MICDPQVEPTDWLLTSDSCRPNFVAIEVTTFATTSLPAVCGSVFVSIRNRWSDPLPVTVTTSGVTPAAVIAARASEIECPAFGNWKTTPPLKSIDGCSPRTRMETIERSMTAPEIAYQRLRRATKL